MNTVRSPDDQSYPNYVFTDTHPSRLAAVARLFGLPAPSSASARVLEIGCAAGLNTLAHADSLPGATFTAIDPAVEQIKTANQLLSDSQLRNVSFVAKSAEQFDSADSSFDYIICHGVFSWVTKHDQHEILKTCRRLLSEHGVAYISYNCLPGWHIQNILRDLLQFNATISDGVQDRVAEAKQLLGFSKALFPTAVQSLFDERIEHLLEVDDDYVRSEFLGVHNQPLYFSDFRELISQHGLSYLAESDVGSMVPREFSPEVQQRLIELAKGSQSSLEQYCDFLRLRQFRKTLLVRDSCPLSRNIDWQAFKDLWISARTSHVREGYVSKALKGSMLAKLEQAFPYDFRVAELLEGVADKQGYLEQLFQGVMIDDLELRDSPLAVMREGAVEYRISNLVKALLPYGAVVPNLRSESVILGKDLREAIVSGRSLTEGEKADACRLALLGKV